MRKIQKFTLEPCSILRWQLLLQVVAWLPDAFRILRNDRREDVDGFISGTAVVAYRSSANKPYFCVVFRGDEAGSI